MKSTFKTILAFALILACSMAACLADIPPPPGEPYIRPVPPNEPVIIEQPADDPAPTPPDPTPQPQPQPKPVKRGCGSGGLAEVAMLCFVATAAIQLRRVSRNRSENTNSSTKGR